MAWIVPSSRLLWRPVLAVAAALLAVAISSPSYAQPASAPATGESRFALVIGSDAYANAPLKTAANDASLIADTLKSAGFEVSGARNLDQETFRASFREFLDKVAAAGPQAVASLYVSGYGLQYEGENYIVPSGSRIAKPTDIPLGAIRMSDLLRPLEGVRLKARLIIFDLAHQGNILPRDAQIAPGLTLVEPEVGSLIGFNSAPGTSAPPQSGPYGAYAQALAEAMHEPGASLDEIFARARMRVSELTEGRVVPWESSRIEQPFILFERGDDAPPPRVSRQQIDDMKSKPLSEFSVEDGYEAAMRRDTIVDYEAFLAAFPASPYSKDVRGLVAARREALTWQRSVKVNSRDAYWSYLKRYPKGPHAGDARRKLARLAAAAQPPASFAGIEYDVAAPPVEEDIYFEGTEFVYFDRDVRTRRPASIYLPPEGYELPPVVEDDQQLYLWTPQREDRSGRPRPPSYVVDPRPPLRQDNGGGLSPYVAIPAAVAIGIAAGRLFDRRDARRPDQPAVRQQQNRRQPQPRVQTQQILAPVSQPFGGAQDFQQNLQRVPGSATNPQAGDGGNNRNRSGGQIQQRGPSGANPLPGPGRAVPPAVNQAPGSQLPAIRQLPAMQQLDRDAGRRQQDQLRLQQQQRMQLQQQQQRDRGRQQIQQQQQQNEREQARRLQERTRQQQFLQQNERNRALQQQERWRQLQQQQQQNERARAMQQQMQQQERGRQLQQQQQNDRARSMQQMQQQQERVRQQQQQQQQQQRVQPQAPFGRPQPQSQQPRNCGIFGQPPCQR